MKPMKPQDENLTRWIDGETDDPTPSNTPDEWKTHAADARRLGQSLRDHFSATAEVAGPEMFMHQLEHRIDRLEEQARPKPEGRLLWWMTRASLAAAAAIVLGVIAFQWGAGSGITAQPALVSTFAPDQSIVVEGGYDPSINAIVLVIEGLDPVYPENEWTGFHSIQPPVAERITAPVAHPADHPQFELARTRTTPREA